MQVGVEVCNDPADPSNLPQTDDNFSSLFNYSSEQTTTGRKIRVSKHPFLFLYFQCQVFGFFFY